MESTGQISTDEIKTLNVKRKIKIILLGKFYTQNNPEVGSSALKLHSTRCVALGFFQDEINSRCDRTTLILQPTEVRLQESEN